MIKQLTFDYPFVFFFLWTVPIILFIYQRLYIYRRDKLSGFSDPTVLAVILRERSPLIFFSKSVALALAVAFLLIALANPKGNPSHPGGDSGMGIVKRKPHEVILLVDASASMGVEDTHSKESRLIYAKEIADQIVSLLKGESVSLYAFTSVLTQISPETHDYFFVRMMINQIQLNEGDVAGTDFTKVLLEFRNKYLDRKSDKIKTLVILSDGEDNAQANMKAISEIGESASENQMIIYTVGIGSKEGKEVPDLTYEGKPVVSVLDPEILKNLASVGKGKYYSEEDGSPYFIAKSIADKIESGPSSLKEKREVQKGEEFYVYDYYFQYPLGIALFLLIFVLFFPDCIQREER